MAVVRLMAVVHLMAVVLVVVADTAVAGFATAAAAIAADFERSLQKLEGVDLS